MKRTIKTARAVRVALSVILAAIPITLNAAVPTAANHARRNLGAEWWQFALSFSNAANPINDETGAACQTGQNGRIWYLFGTFGNEEGSPTVRNCTVPNDRWLFFPVANFICTAFPGETAQILREQCAAAAALIDLLEVSVDGAVVANSPPGFRHLLSDAFSVVVPEDNLFGVGAGVYGPAVDDGYYMLLKPFAAGPHTVRIRGGASALGLLVDVIYNLDVVEPGPVILP